MASTLVSVLEKQVRSAVAFFLLRIKTHMHYTNCHGKFCTMFKGYEDCRNGTDERWEKVIL